MTTTELRSRITGYEERRKVMQESGLEGAELERLILLAEIAYQLARLNEKGSASWPGPR